MYRHISILMVLLFSAMTAFGQANSVLGWGINGSGEIGDNTTANRNRPTPAYYVSGIKSVAAGAFHTLALTSNGRVHAWGSNTYGQLGLGDTVDRSTPTLIPGLAGIIAIAAGHGHSLALDATGQIYTWGWNIHGELGLGDYNDRHAPAASPAGVCRAISAGLYHSLAIKVGAGYPGWVISTGSNAKGQLGLGPETTTSSTWVIPGPYASAIAAGAEHSIILSQGTLACCGANDYGQIGDGTFTTSYGFTGIMVNVRAIAAGPYAYHTLAIRTNGTVMAWGRNADGQLGDGTKIDRRTPVEMHNVQYAKAATAGALHTVVLRANGTAVACGYNGDGRLGDGTLTNRVLPVTVVSSSMYTAVSAGYGHTVALKCMDAARAWGKGIQGQLGNGGTGNKLLPTLMSGLGTSVVALAAGELHTLALKADGTVWACGDNTYGELGIGPTGTQLKPIKITTLANVIAIAAGGYHSLAVTADGILWSWGANGFGQLGLGDLFDRYYPDLVDSGVYRIAAGLNYSLASAWDGSVWAWGDNSQHQCSGNFTPLFTPDRVELLSGENSFERPIDLAAGAYHSFLVSRYQRIWCWGDNAFGQLGLGDNTDRVYPTELPGSAAKAVACGDYHTLHLNDEGNVYTTGRNASSQLGIGDNIDRNVWVLAATYMTGISAGSFHSASLNADGNLFLWGNNAEGELGDGTFVQRPYPTHVVAHLYTTGLWVGPTAYHSAALSCPPIMLYTLKLSPTAVTGGSSATGTVTLTSVAGAGGLTVTLASNNPAATVPPTVTVPAGLKSATFTVTTHPVSVVTKPTITATLVVSKTAVLTVNP